MGIPYVIRVSSQKGGVGKTTIAVNLATALRRSGYGVLLVDTDIVSPAVGEYFGIRNSNIGYADLLQGGVEVKNAIFAYQPIDLSVIAGTYMSSAYDPDQKKLMKDLESFYAQIKKLDYDFVIIDSPPGAIPTGTAKFYDEVLIVATPERVSCSGSRALAKQCEKNHLKCRMIINKRGHSKYEPSLYEMQMLYGDLVEAVIPENEIIPESLIAHVPAHILSEDNPFTKAIKNLSKIYSLRIESDRRGSKGVGNYFGSVSKIAGLS